MAKEHESFSEGLVPPGEPITGKTYRADGWAYRVIPKITPNLMNLLLNTLGKENYKLLAYTEHSKGYITGQILISPEGRENLINYLKDEK